MDITHVMTVLGTVHEIDGAIPVDATAPLQVLLDHWTGLIQGLVASIGGLAFVLAFLWKIIAVEPRSVMEAKRWIGRIVFGTLGVELATQLVHVLQMAGQH
jgi:hypothetical protein